MTLATALAFPALIVLALASFIHDLLTDLRRKLREAETQAEFDEDTTLKEWLASSFPERHLTLLARPNAAGGGTSPTREATSTHRETETSAP